MTEPTEAHRAEARRRLAIVDAPYAFTNHVEVLAQALAENAWTPPEDPDLVEARANLDWLTAVANTSSTHVITPNAAGRLSVLVEKYIAIKRRQS